MRLLQRQHQSPQPLQGQRRRRGPRRCPPLRPRPRRNLRSPPRPRLCPPLRPRPRRPLRQRTSLSRLPQRGYSQRIRRRSTRPLYARRWNTLALTLASDLELRPRASPYWLASAMKHSPRCTSTSLAETFRAYITRRLSIRMLGLRGPRVAAP